MPRNTTFLAVALAIVLFLVADHFDNRTVVRLPEHRELAMNPQRESSLRGPVRSTETAGSCDLAESELQQAVENSVYCATDDDCALVDFGYPIQCMMSVAKAEITPLRLQYRRYQSNCRYRVYYDCDTEGAERIPVCRNKRCAVALDTIDSLKDETLDFLGIER